jgi:hypothetical protein
VLTPAIKALIESTGELRAVIVIGDDFDGITPGGTWEDFRTGPPAPGEVEAVRGGHQQGLGEARRRPLRMDDCRVK